MKTNRKPQKRRLTPFERETERRRREMLAHLAGRQANVPSSLLRILPRSMRLMLIPEKKAHIQVRTGGVGAPA